MVRIRMLFDVILLWSTKSIQSASVELSSPITFEIPFHTNVFLFKKCAHLQEVYTCACIIGGDHFNG